MEGTLEGLIVCLLIGGLVGFFVGYKIGYNQPHDDDRTFNFQTAPGVTMRLHYLGKLTDKQFKLLCWWITDGKPFRLLPLMQSGILSRGQFMNCREELVNRRMAYRTRARTTEITLPGYAFFRWGAGRRKQTNDNANRQNAVYGKDG